jgi:hypothetical protein
MNIPPTFSLRGGKGCLLRQTTFQSLIIANALIAFREAPENNFLGLVSCALLGCILRAIMTFATESKFQTR